MPRIKHTSYTPEFRKMMMVASDNRENRDCMVKALTLLTGLPYAQVNEALLAAGRKPKRGTRWFVTNAALAALGFKLEELKTDEYQSIIDQYPGVHSRCQSITSHHPRRFSKVWARIEPLLFDFGRHVAAFKDGQLHDWTVNKALRAKSLYRVVPLNVCEAQAEAVELEQADLAPAEPAESGWFAREAGLDPHTLRAIKENTNG